MYNQPTATLPSLLEGNYDAYQPVYPVQQSPYMQQPQFDPNLGYQPTPVIQQQMPGFQQQMPGFQQQMPGFQQQSYSDQYLAMVQPVVEYGLNEARVTNLRHAMMETALISYLMGMGYNFQQARQMVESWEINEQFPMYR